MSNTNLGFGIWWDRNKEYFNCSEYEAREIWFEAINTKKQEDLVDLFIIEQTRDKVYKFDNIGLGLLAIKSQELYKKVLQLL